MSDYRSLAARCALGAIRVYQRHLSPRKGFTCALRGATGGRSCSAYGYRVIARCGLRKGLRLLRRRLDACGQQHRFGEGPLSYQQGHCDLGFPDVNCDGCGQVLDFCSPLANITTGSCGSGRGFGTEMKMDDADSAALRARVEEAKRRNASGE